MRATRTEERASFNGEFDMADLLGWGWCETVAELVGELLAKSVRDGSGVDRSVMSDDGSTVMNRLANNPRRIRASGENVANCGLDNGLLLFDDDELFNPRRKLKDG